MASIHADNVDQKVERSNDPGRTSSLFVVNSGLEMGSDAKSRGSSILASDQWHGTIMKAYSDFMDISNPVPETKMDPKKTRKEATEESQVRAERRTVFKNTDTEKVNLRLSEGWSSRLWSGNQVEFCPVHLVAS